MNIRHIIILAFSVQALFSTPIMVGALAEQFSFPEAMLGGVAAADLAGFSLACLWVYLKGYRIQWKYQVAVSALLVVLANIGCSAADDFISLLILRGVAGIGSGVLYSIATLAIGRSEAATSQFGWSMAAQALVAMLYLGALPHLLAIYGLAVLYWLLALMALICGLMAFGMQTIAAKTTRDAANLNSGIVFRLGSLVLMGVFVLYLGQGGYTAFIERIGFESGIDAEFIGYCLAASTFAGIVAGLVAGYQSGKLGMRIPLLLVFVGQTIAVSLLFDSFITPMAYLAAVVLYNFFWTYVVPYHLSLIAQQDSGGRLIALAPAVQGAGLAVGSGLSGGLLEATAGYHSLLVFMMISGLVSLVIIFQVATASQKNSNRTVETAYN